MKVQKSNYKKKVTDAEGNKQPYSDITLNTVTLQQIQKVFSEWKKSCSWCSSQTKQQSRRKSFLKDAKELSSKSLCDKQVPTSNGTISVCVLLVVLNRGCSSLHDKYILALWVLR